MVSASYVPDRVHIVWVRFADGWGHEQRGRRPAFVVSPEAYNAPSGLVLVCPMTRQAKGYPFEVPLDVETVHGAVLVDQLQSVDWRARRAQYAGRAPREVLREVQEKLKQLIE
jgi:mRNA interferase MazF